MEIDQVSTYIPDDLAISILSKLPLKAFNRFQCVKKSWLCLPNNNYFMTVYLKNFLSNKSFLYEDNTCFFVEVNPHNYQNSLYLLSGERFKNRVKLDWPPQFQDNQAVTILNSPVNGTICLHQGDTKIVLWNPTTNELQALPSSPLKSPWPFYKKTSFRVHGFGYDPVRDDYKVLRHLAHRIPFAHYKGYIPPHRSMWEIYSRRSNSWRKLEFDIPSVYPCTFGVRVQGNGVCHWWDEDKDFMMSFDLSKDVFLTTTLPPEDLADGFQDRLGRPDKYLVLLNGSIALITTHTYATFHISVLGVLGVKESWAKLFVVQPKISISFPIGAGNKGDIYFVTEDDELVCFDLRTEKIEKLGIDWHEPSLQAVLYKEILLSINGFI